MPTRDVLKVLKLNTPTARANLKTFQNISRDSKSRNALALRDTISYT